MKNHYYSFNDYLRERFKVRVHRVNLNAHFACPNRDGTLSSDGCIFCNEEGFSPVAGTAKSLEAQIRDGMEFARKRFGAEKFIAYFQNASNTYADAETLKKTYDVVSDFPDIVGLFISTRPDCVDGKKLDLIESYSGRYEVWIEYGMQSASDSSLDRINRGHSFRQFEKAVLDTSKRNIKIGAHVILGLPGESKTDMMKTAESIADLPVNGVKLHVLHVLKDTRLEKEFEQGKIKLLELREYVNLICDFMERLRPDCVMLRLVSDAKQNALVAPKWINAKQKIILEIENEFKKRGARQGNKYAEESMRIWQL